MAKIEIPQELVLPTPENNREAEIFKALQEGYRNIVLAFQNFQDANTLLFVQTASANVNNTLTETTLVSTGNGNPTLEAGYLQAGKKLRVKASGFYSTLGTPTLQLKVKLGSTVILDTTAVATPAGAANKQWTIEGIITVRTNGTGGTVIAQGQAILAISTTANQPEQMVNTGTIAVDTTTALAVSVTAQWGTASASNTITCTNLSVESMN